MSAKIFRDPLYDYISIDPERDGWILKLLDTPEVQRLRRIHQLGISYMTYPGATHNRLAHSLGVVHLTQQAFNQLASRYNTPQVMRAREPLLAMALLHDVGHGPFSHVFEPCLGIKHEKWSEAIILSPDTAVNRILRKEVGENCPKEVAELISGRGEGQSAWKKYLLSSQLDMDRLDYLRRDSLFTGAGYGHFDHFRILNTFDLVPNSEGDFEIVWEEKAALAIEEYIFSRYYMFQNVYLHKTTRGFEKMLETMWKRAKDLFQNGTDPDLVPAIKRFWSQESPSIQDYLDLEEFTVLQQIQNWTRYKHDKDLADLAGRFLNRIPFAMILPPESKETLFDSKFEQWEEQLKELIKSHAEYQSTEMYLLRDELKAKYNQPYFPEKEENQQGTSNAIRIRTPEGPVEISQKLQRLKPLMTETTNQVRYYIPKELRNEAIELRRKLSNV